MKLICLETSAKTASAAIVTEGKVLGLTQITAGLTHSQTVLPALSSLLSGCSMSIADADGFAVSIGPGSFTGVRIGISAAKGLAAARNLPCAGVSTLLSLAFNYRDTDCIVCAVMDARCNQVYNAIFEISGGKITRLCEDRAVLCEELAENLKKVSQNGEKRVIIVGDGTDVFFPFAENIPGVCKSAPERRYQNAVSAALAAEDIFKNGLSVTPDKLLPVYLRLPQAERELKKKKEVSL